MGGQCNPFMEDLGRIIVEVSFLGEIYVGCIGPGCSRTVIYIRFSDRDRFVRV